MTKRSITDLYIPKFNGDEVTMVPGGCLRPWACSCVDGDSQCGMTIEEIKTYLYTYYKSRADHILNLTPNQLMVELGFYTYN